MKKINKKAFSLSEMMVVMLIMTIVMAASAPIITKKSARPSATGATIPTGTIVAYYGTTPPTGWLLCNGQSAAIYPELAALVGTNVPDLRGRTLIGLDNMGGASKDVVTDPNADTLGGTAGQEKHLLTVSEMPSHKHSYTGSNEDNGDPGDLVETAAVGNQENGLRYSSSMGGDQPHNNMQPYMALNYIIKI